MRERGVHGARFLSTFWKEERTHANPDVSYPIVDDAEATFSKAHVLVPAISFPSIFDRLQGAIVTGTHCRSVAHIPFHVRVQGIRAVLEPYTQVGAHPRYTVAHILFHNIRAGIRAVLRTSFLIERVATLE